MLIYIMATERSVSGDHSYFELRCRIHSKHEMFGIKTNIWPLNFMCYLFIIYVCQFSVHVFFLIRQSSLILVRRDA